jgi:hypothetical protein
MGVLIFYNKIFAINRIDPRIVIRKAVIIDFFKVKCQQL